VLKGTLLFPESPSVLEPVRMSQEWPRRFGSVLASEPGKLPDQPRPDNPGGKNLAGSILQVFEK